MTETTTLQPAVASRQRTPWFALLTLAFAVFATVTVEMVPAGLLPAMSADFGVSPSSIGLLVSLWAVTIIVASLPIVRLTARVDRRTLIVGALAVMAVANALTAIAPGYEFALASRVIAAMAHGAFWSVVMVYATSLVPASAAGRTVAIVSAGASGATVAGIPLGTVVGQVADWRLVFGALALALALIAVVIRLRLPSSPGAAPSPADGAGSAGAVRGRRRVDRSIRPVLAAAVACTLTAAASFTLFTYISPYLTEVAGLPEAWVGPLLLGFGVAGIGGLVAAALTADRWPVASLATMTVLFAVALAVLGLAPQSPPAVIAGLLVWGLAIGGLPAMLQSRLLGVASPALRGTASALMVVFFNGGIALGATLGGLFDDGSNLVLAAFAAAGLGALAIVAVVASRALAGR
ncbi:putative MFS family arabinose efflux permease [Agromyces sp. 3263]|uniref:MFS transporter n=1 Tax=Agromyces sp. 3263 TaxID=2817750 RepID=UPI0028621408|nr:MFS transporter [Agromyces sp. 3263]MDR6905526.1 putative MFS family arabinose efflux permease [Agromyces sp. 3263]